MTRPLFRSWFVRALATTLCTFVVTSTVTTFAGPEPRHGLHFTTPVTVWDEALPLGNGLLGALVWGDGQPLRISLDRTDLWDLRLVPEFHSEEYSYALMRQWVREKRLRDLHRLYDNPYGHAGPTKIPAGRIELRIDGKPAFVDTTLDLAGAVATVRLAGNTSARVLVHAVEPVGLIEIDTNAAIDARVAAPPFAGDVKDPAGPGKISAGDLASLGYPAPVETKGQGHSGFVQTGWKGFRFAVWLGWRRVGGESERWLGAWSIATSQDSDDPLGLARKRCERALDAGFAAMRRSHQQWWSRYWSQSSVSVPNAAIERQWYLETYKFGAAARADTPPITLQGPWTADNGRIPPWKGDYHHDLNTELCYWPCYSGNHLDGGRGFVDWLWKTRDTAKAWTRRFFDMPGFNVPMTADLAGRQIGGWHQYTHSSTTAAWLAHHFWLHWRHSGDDAFLRDRLYPYLRDVAVFLDAVTEKGADGKRVLPLSSSPETHDNRLAAWFPTITNYDLALIRWAFGTAADLAAKLEKKDDEARWRKALAEMPELALDPGDRRLLVAKGHPLHASHRHFSHLMAIHPLGLIRWENGEDDRKTIRAALAELERLGTSWWTGYSFSWHANVAARARDGETAARALELFSTAFCLRNGFHCNGDQSGKGHSRFRYRPFTLEGNFAMAAGLQEMLLQSYSGTIRVFPAIPAAWKDVSFKTLRAEGAFLVSATREDGVTKSLRIRSERGGECRVEDPFAGKRTRFAIIAGPPNTLRVKDGSLLLRMSPGGEVELRLAE